MKINIAHPKLLIYILVMVLLVNFVNAWIDCTPSSCPSGYTQQGSTNCTGPTCTNYCYVYLCTGSWSQVYSDSRYMPDHNYDDDGTGFGGAIGHYTPTDTSKCYRFRYAGNNNWVSSSDIDDVNTDEEDSWGAFYWDSSNSWYNNQKYYCNANEYGRTVWIDNDIDDGDHFQSADNLGATADSEKYLYCAPNSVACSQISNYCDTNCYDYDTELDYYFECQMEEDSHDDHDFSSYCNVDTVSTDSYINYVNFNGISVYMYVDEKSTTQNWQNQTCERTNEPPQISGCSNANINEDSSASSINIDLYHCTSDVEESDSELTFSVETQTNPNLINCTISGNRNVTCQDPIGDGNGINTLTILVVDPYDNENRTDINITLNPINDNPSFNESTEDDSSQEEPTEQGFPIRFTAVVEEPDNENITLLICDSNGISGLSCSNTEYCRDNSTHDGVKSCVYSTDGLTQTQYSWKSYACDSNNCVSGATGIFYVTLKPKQPRLYVNDSSVWNKTIYFTGPETITNFEAQLNNSLASCTPDGEGYCTIALKFSSESKGKLNITHLRIIAIADITPPFINITSPINNTVYNTSSIDLNWTANETLNWCSYSLDGGENVTDICTEWIYQEDANETSTSAANFLYVNYNKPITTVGIIWQVKHGFNQPTYNISLPSPCFNQSSIQLRIYSGEGDSYPQCYNGTSWVIIGNTYVSNSPNQGNPEDASKLHDGDWGTYAEYLQGWKYGAQSGAEQSRIYEEAIWWKMLVSPRNTSLIDLLEGHHNIIIYGSDTSGNMGQSDYVYFTVGTPSTIGINLINPTLNINITQNKFFNFTAQVCCYDNNCSEINVSLDPETDKVDYTSSTETHCKSNVCTKTLYSGIRFIYEDNKWKRREEARSFKGSPIKCLVISDNEHFAECVDWNETSRTVAFYIKEKTGINKSILLRKYNIMENKRVYDESFERNLKFSSINDKKRYTYKVNPGDILEFGEHSTIIVLDEPDTENLEDAYFAEAFSKAGNETIMLIDDIDGQGSIPFFKFNISAIPDNSIIENAVLCLYTSTSSDENVDVWRVANQTWKEEEIDDLCNNGVYCSDIDNMLTTHISSGSGTDTMFESLCLNVTDGVITDYNAENINSSFALNNTGDPSDYYQIYSKEYALAADRPYLNITYTEVKEKGLINTTTGATPFYTNGTNPTTITLNQNQCQNITWWVNATGELDTYTFFAYANKTSDMSISNKTSEVNITIVEEEAPPQDTHKFHIKNSSGNSIAWFGNYGNLVLKGNLTQNTTITPTANDEFRFRANGNDVMLIDQTNGNMYIKGFLYENQNNLNPTQQSDDFIVRNASKDVVAYVNESGYLFLKGKLYQNSNP